MADLSYVQCSTYIAVFSDGERHLLSACHTTLFLQVFYVSSLQGIFLFKKLLEGRFQFCACDLSSCRRADH